MASVISCDLAIVGGGLAGALIATAVRTRHPGCDVRLIEAGERVGGNHLWSFFASDVAPADRWIVDGAITHRWPGYRVAFPGHARRIEEAYHSIESEALDRMVRRVLPAGALLTGRPVALVEPTAIELADGDRIEATGVIDARGTGNLAAFDCGWQKFVGRELRLAAPHADERPTVMDATVAQHDGYRFIYLLPFAADRMFVEDTYYSDTPALDAGLIVQRIERFAGARGWRVAGAGRAETGVLPVAMGGDLDRYWREGGPVAKAGMRAGLFHPLTGYSLPDAVRTAAMLATRRDFGGAALAEATWALARRTWRDRRFYRMLATMLFRAAEPGERYRVLERFYTLRPGLIGRLYSGQSTMADKVRILAGRPPVPVARAVRALAGRGTGAGATA